MPETLRQIHQLELAATRGDQGGRRLIGAIKAFSDSRRLTRIPSARR